MASGGAPFTQTYSSISKYLTCPRQYQASYVSNEVQYKSSGHARFGTWLHHWMEKVAQHPTPPPETAIVAAAKRAPEEFSALGKGNVADHLRRVVSVIKDMRTALPNARFETETKLCVNHQGFSAPYGDRTGFVRGSVDLIATNETPVALVVDLKSGKPVRDDLQVKISAAMLMARDKHIEEVRAKYAYTGGHASHEIVMTRADAKETLQETRYILRNIEESYRTHTFAPNPNGLCKAWCDVVKCVHNGKFATN